MNLYKKIKRKIFLEHDKKRCWKCLESYENEPFGYVIEYTFTNKKISYDSIYWNHKLYEKLETAEEALNNIKKSSRSENYEYRIVPLYKEETIGDKLK